MKLLDSMLKKLNDLKYKEIKARALELSNRAKKAIDDIDVDPLVDKGKEIAEQVSELSSKAKKAIDDIDVDPLIAKGKEVGEKVSELSNKAKKTIDDVNVESIKAKGKDVADKISNLSDSAQSKFDQLIEERKENIENKIKEKEEKKAAEIRRKEEEKRRRKEEEREKYEKLSIIEKIYFKIKEFFLMLFAIVLLVVFVVMFISIVVAYFNEDAEESTKPIKAIEEHSEVVKPGVYYVKVDVLEVRLLPSSSGSITNRLYRRQKLDVYEVKNRWARVSKYYDGEIEGKSGRVARWVHTNGLSSRRP